MIDLDPFNQYCDDLAKRTEETLAECARAREALQANLQEIINVVTDPDRKAEAQAILDKMFPPDEK